MSRVVRDYGCGVIASGFTVKALTEALRGLDAERIEALKAGADRAARELNAEANREVVLRLVDEALAR
jgi:hypothetical protein